MPSTSDKYVFRSTLGWVWFGLAVAVCGYLLIDMAVRASVWDAFLVTPWLAGICWLVWIFQVSPRIVADEDGARVVNVLRVIDMPWSAVESVRLKYNAEFVLRTGAKVTAWGGSSRRLHKSIKRRSVEDPAEQEAEALQRLHADTSNRGGYVNRTWDVPALAALLVIVVWIAFSLIQKGGFVLP
jgi:hypothetical protein